jgi:predicted nucleic acid-binding protein
VLVTLLAACTSGAATPATTGATTPPTVAEATQTTGAIQSPATPTPVAYTTQTPAADLPWTQHAYPALGLRVSWPEGWPILHNEGRLDFEPPGLAQTPRIMLGREFDAPLEPAGLEAYVTQKLKGMPAPGDFRTAKLQVAGKQSLAVWGLTNVCLQVYLPLTQRVYALEFMPDLCAAGGNALNDLGQTFLDGLATTGSGTPAPYSDATLGVALDVPAGLKAESLTSGNPNETGVSWMDSLSTEVLRITRLHGAGSDQVEKLAQAVIDTYPGLSVTRSEATLGGQWAVKLSNVPGRVASTDFFAAAYGRVYRLSVPEPSAELAQPMLDSLRFIPPA